VAVIVWMKQCL